MSNGIGDEDVLDDDTRWHGQDGEEPVERSRFHRKRDVAAVALITAAAVVGGLLLWQGSDIRATTSTTYDAPVTSPAPLTAFPPSLAEAWRVPSPATPVPVTAGPALVTGDGGDVVGRDPLTGEERWRYSRELELCTVTSAWSMAVAVHAKTSNLLPADDPRKAGGCSEITALDPATGHRGQPPDGDGGRPDLGQRNSDAELGTRLLFDGSYLTATGGQLLHTYRSDLVLTMEYGRVPTLVNPNRQPRTGCDYGTVAVEAGKIAVVERCPDDSSDRVTVYRATGDDSSEEPEVTFSVETGVHGARVLAMSDECRIGTEDDQTQLCTAVVEPDPARLVVYDEEGNVVAEHPLSLAPGDLPDEDPPGHVVPTYEAPGAWYWFTGSRTIALGKADLRPLWTVGNAVGPGTLFAGRMLVPVRDGIRVLNPATGEVRGTIPVDRGEHTGLVTMSSIGPMVYEQRGDTVVALR